MAIHTIYGYDGNKNPVAPINVSERTWNKITIAIDEGATIVINKSWDYRGKARGFRRTKKLAQTNSRIHKYPKHVVWACYK